ncbi:MAG: hypothetical protein J5741_05305 [Bacteroidales bacterium]|nr:hypothetical protein [Bacteroidales bacterium]
MKRLLFLIVLSSALAVYAQCPDFTNLTGAGVTCQYGSVTNPFQHTGLVPGRHSVITQQGTDPNTGGQLPLLPPGESAVVKLGNENVGSEAEAITYDITVDADNPILQVNFAVVFQDPSHPYDVQPHFLMRVLNIAGELIDSCAQYNVTAAYGIEGFQSYHSVRFLPWKKMSISLADYIGQQVKLQFVTYDCGWQGHYGYAYFTATCISNKLTVNNIGGGQIAVSAPDGFPNYNWDNHTYTNPTTYPLDPAGTSVNCLVVTNVNCYFTLSGLFATGVGPTTSQVYYDTICEGDSYHQHYFNLPPQQSLGTHIYRNVYLDPSNPNAQEVIITLYLTILKKFYHIYDHICVGTNYEANGFNIPQPQAGKRLDTLYLPRAGLCDSAVVLHLSVSYPFVLPETISGETVVCDGEEFIYAWPGAEVLDTILWSLPAGVANMSGQWGPSVRVYFTPETPNPAVISVSAVNGCGSGSLSLSVTHNPSYHLFIRDTLCSGNEYQEHGFYLARQDSVGVFTFTAENTTQLGCDSTSILELLVVHNPELTTLAQPMEICPGDSTAIHAMGSNSGIDNHVLYPLTVAIGDILCTDSSIVKPSDWPVAGKTAMGIVFYVDNTGEHGWAVSLEEYSELQWCDLWPTVDIANLPNFSTSWDAMFDLDGYSNTQIIRNEPSTNWWLNQQQAFPAAWAVDFDHGWYLPALGQLRILYGTWGLINPSLQLVGGTLFDMNPTSLSGLYYWSSTEENDFRAYYISYKGEIWSNKQFANGGPKVRGIRNF